MASPLEKFWWKETELKIKFEKDWYEWEKVKLQLEKISQEEKIDWKLTELEWNVDNYYVYLKWLIDETPVDKIKEKAEEAIEKTTDEAEKMAMGFFEKNVPWGKAIMAMIKKFESAFDTAWEVYDKKGVIASVSVFFGMLFWKVALDKSEEEGSKENQAEGIETKPVDSEGNGDNEVAVEDRAEENQKTNPENIEKKENYIYKWWFNLLLSLSWIKLENNISKRKISEWLSKHTLASFIKEWWISSFRDKVLWDEKNNDSLIKQYEKVYESFTWNNIKDLLRIWLKPELIKKILLWREWNIENKNLKKLFWDRFWKILELIDKLGFNYKELTIEELSTLYINTIPALTNSALFTVSWSMWTMLTEFIWIENWNEFIEEAKKQNLFSQKLLDGIIKYSWAWENIKSPEKQMVSDLKLNDTKDIEDLKKLYEFKESIFSGDFLNNNKLRLSEKHKTLLLSKLNYKNILALYSILWGQSIENINIINLPIIALLLSKVMSSWNNASDSLISSSYLMTFSKDILTNNKDFLTDDQITVMNIYRDKMIDILVMSKLKNFYWAIWFVTDNEWMMDKALVTWGAWVWLSYIWSKWIKKAIDAGKLPFISKWVKRAWIAWILWWVILWWLSAISKNDNFEKFDDDLKDAYDNKDVDKIIELFEKQKEWLKSYERNWKNIFLVTYEWSDPYVIYNNKIYSFEIYDKSTSLEESNALEYFINSIDFISKRSNTIDWKNLKPISVEWDDIIFWDNAISINFKNSISSWENLLLDNDLKAKLTSAVKKIDQDREFILWDWERTEIIKVSDLWENLLLWLVPIWELEIKEVK